MLAVRSREFGECCCITRHKFDAVIVWNAADEQYAPDSEADRRKLYVVSTRAMHQLIFHKYPNTPSTLGDALIRSGLVLRA